MSTVEAELASDLGGAPSCAQRLIIQSAATKATRLFLLSEKLLGGDEPGEDGHHALSWLNSMRLDLCALGLERRAKNITSNHLADHFSRPFTEAAE